MFKKPVYYICHKDVMVSEQEAMIFHNLNSPIFSCLNNAENLSHMKTHTLAKLSLHIQVVMLLCVGSSAAIHRG